jgi:ATP synthase B/B' CF(0)
MQCLQPAARVANRCAVVSRAQPLRSIQKAVKCVSTASDRYLSLEYEVAAITPVCPLGILYLSLAANSYLYWSIPQSTVASLLVLRAEAGTCVQYHVHTLGVCCRKMDMSSVTKPVSTVIFTNLIMASPAFAEGKLFDFGLTLPIMAGQFLLLMVFLDKTWFTPVGKVLDERDELIRSKLSAVKGDSSKLAEMQAEAERLLKEARDAATAAVNEARATTQAEQDAKMETLRAVRRPCAASDSVTLVGAVISLLARSVFP